MQWDISLSSRLSEKIWNWLKLAVRTPATPEPDQPAQAIPRRKAA